MADHGGPTTRPTSGPTTYPTSGPTTYPTSGPTTPTTYPTSGGGTSGMSGLIVGHVGSDRRACRARSSGMSGPIVGHVGPDRRACRARSSGMSGTSGPTSGDRRVVGCQKLPFSASIDTDSTIISSVPISGYTLNNRVHLRYVRAIARGVAPPQDLNQNCYNHESTILIRSAQDLNQN